MTTKKFCLIIIIMCSGIINSSVPPQYYQECDHYDQGCREIKAAEADHTNNIEPENRDHSWKNPNLPFWSKIKSAGDDNFPSADLKKIRSYPMYFFEFNEKYQIIDKETKQVLECNFLFRNISFRKIF